MTGMQQFGHDVWALVPDAPAALAALADGSLPHPLARRPHLLSPALSRAGRQPGPAHRRGHPPLH